MFEEVERVALMMEDSWIRVGELTMYGTGSLVAVSKGICEMGPCEISNQYSGLGVNRSMHTAVLRMRSVTSEV